jgi:hypothetical protein
MLEDRQDRGEEAGQLGASTQAIVDEAFEIALPYYLERMESSQHRQDEQVDASEAPEQHFQGSQSDCPLSQMNEGLGIAPQATADESFLLPQTEHTDTDVMLPMDLNFQQIDGSSHPTVWPSFPTTQALPSDITQLFDPYGSIFGGTDADTGGFMSHVNNEYWANVKA